MAFNIDEGLIEDIQTIGRNYAVKQIVLFGSRARGDHKPVSDIDLAIFLSESNCIGQLASDLEDLNTLLKIDAIFINDNLDPKLLENIQKEGVLLYERTEY